MKTHLKINYLEQIRQTTPHWKLRLIINFTALFGYLGVIAGSLMLLDSRHVWLALFNLASLAVVFVLRSLAILIVDVADMLLDRAVNDPAPKDEVAA